MSYLRKPASAGQVVPLRRSADFWMQRAKQYIHKGQPRKAALLLRHAVGLEPAAVDLRVAYAQALQALRCYEASNREAFHVLAQAPSEPDSYQLIGRNMLLLGREQEAIDAYANYLHILRQRPDALVYEEELYSIEDLLYAPQEIGYARYDALLAQASDRLAARQYDRALVRLRRAAAQRRRDERLHALYANAYLALKQPDRALLHARLAVREAPDSVQALCVLANALSAKGLRGQAGAALLKAAPLCRYSQEEQVYCATALWLNLPQTALWMLQHNLAQSPDRVPTLSNLCVLSIYQGDLAAAQRYALRCRDIDPADVACQYEYEVVQKLLDSHVTADKLRDHFRDIRAQYDAIPLYPKVGPTCSKHLLRTLTDKLEGGVDTFCQALLEDAGFQERFLFAMELPGIHMERLLQLAALNLPKADAEALLRKALVLPDAQEELKRCAAACLLTLEAKPPYVVYHNGRIAQITLTASPESAPADPRAALRALMELLLERTECPQAVSLAMRLLNRMPRATQRVIAADPPDVWAAAFALYAFQELGPVRMKEPAPVYAFAKDLRRRIRPALRFLRQLEETPESDHRKDEP